MSGKTTVDVVVVGGGVIGLAAAWRLAQRGLEVVLLERDACGRSSSWAAAGILAPGNPNRHGPMSVLHLRTLEMFPEFAAELEDVSGLGLEYERCGQITLCHTDQRYRMGLSEVRATAERRAPDGGPVLEMLSMAQAREREPGIGVDGFGALHCRTTARVRNTRLLKALRQACMSVGVVLREGCPVRGLAVEGDTVHGVLLDGETVEAPWVVAAAGAWSSALHPLLEQAARVFPSRGQAVLLHMADPPLRGVVKRQHCYLVARPDGHVFLGATDEPEAGFNTRPTAGAMSELMSAALALLPGLAEAGVVNLWAGLRPLTEDHRPMIGPVPGLEGLLAAYGHYRTGLAYAPLTADAIADLIVAGRTEHDLSHCQPGRQPPPRRSRAN